MGPRDGDQAFTDLGGVLLSEETVDHLLQLATELAERSLPSAASVSLTLPRDGERFTPHATDQAARDLDEVQYATGQGPCLEALQNATVVNAALDQAPDGWAPLATAALERELRSVLSTPLMAEDRALGALNVYSRRADPLPDAEVHLAGLLAQQAGAVLACALAYQDVSAINAQLQEALASRDLIGQAKGILMHTERCDADQAFDILRRASQRTNRKLRDIAAELVAATTRPPDQA
jgi:GAF domain-containing protein